MREDLREVLQRVGGERELRERFTARPRQTKLRPDNLYPRAWSARGWVGLDHAGLHAVIGAERRAQGRQRPLGHTERVPHPATTSAPSITGQPTVGDTLTTQPG